MKVNPPPVLILTFDSRDYPDCLRDLSEEGVEFTIADTPETACERYRGQEIIIGQPDLVAAVLNDMPRVRWVQSSWAGVTPLLKTGRTDYLLTGVKGIFGQQMAEYVLAYLLANELKVFERMRHQVNRNWWPTLSGSLQGKSVGIMGTGSIGAYIARALGHFGVRVTGFSRGGAPAEGFERVYPAHQLHAFLAEPDYLVCVLPDTPGTRHLLDAEAFCKMKNQCCLVNIGRGNVVNELDLVQALEAGELGGAVLDVFQQEPLPRESALWSAPGLVVTGHVAAKSRPEDVAEIFRENYRRYRTGEPLRYLIDFEQGY